MDTQKNSSAPIPERQTETFFDINLDKIKLGYDCPIKGVSPKIDTTLSIFFLISK